MVEDGIDTSVFIVDDDTSGTRFRLDADAPLGGTAPGATLEIGASPNNSYDVNQFNAQTDADFNVRRAEVTFRDDRYGRLQLGKGSSAADDTAAYDLSLVGGPIMYAGVADIAGGIIFTDGTDYSDTTVGDAFYDFDGDRLGRVRYDSPMFGPVQGSASYCQDDQWAAAVLGGDYGDWSGWTVGGFTLLATVSVYNTDDNNVDYAYAASGSFLNDPTGLSLTLSTGGRSSKRATVPRIFTPRWGGTSASGRSARPASASTTPTARTSAATARTANPAVSPPCSASSATASTCTASSAGMKSTTGPSPA